MDSATGSRASLSSVGMGSSGGGGSGGGGDSDENQVTDPQVLIQQLREVKEERDRGSSKYEQVMMIMVFGIVYTSPGGLLICTIP